MLDNFVVVRVVIVVVIMLAVVISDNSSNIKSNSREWTNENPYLWLTEGTKKLLSRVSVRGLVTRGVPRGSLPGLLPHRAVPNRAVRAAGKGERPSLGITRVSTSWMVLT